MTGHIDQWVQRYLELAEVSIDRLKPVATPTMEDSLFTDGGLVDRGYLKDNASKIVQQCLWVARMTRPYLLWAANDLARKITKWTEACDKRLHRLISYMHHTCDHVQ